MHDVACIIVERISTFFGSIFRIFLRRGNNSDQPFHFSQQEGPRAISTSCCLILKAGDMMLVYGMHFLLLEYWSCRSLNGLWRAPPRIGNELDYGQGIYFLMIESWYLISFSTSVSFSCFRPLIFEPDNGRRCGSLASEQACSSVAPPVDAYMWFPSDFTILELLQHQTNCHLLWRHSRPLR